MTIPRAYPRSAEVPMAASGLRISGIVRRSVDHLGKGGNVEVFGARYSGRTEALHRVQRTMTDLGYTVLAVQGAGPEIPLGSIWASLPAEVRRKTGEFLDAPCLALHATIDFLSEGPSVLVVDDAVRLDEKSWAVVETAHKSTQTPLIVSTGPPAKLHSRSQVLARMGTSMLQLNISPMSRGKLHDVLEARLGERLSPSVSARIHTLSAGLPGLAINHLDSALLNGLIRNRGSNPADDIDLWTSEMGGSYEALLGGHDLEVKDAVETLALTGALPPHSAAQLVGQQVLERLEQNLLVETFPGEGDSLVSVTPPGLGVYFRSQPQSARRTRLIARATTVLESSSRGRARLERLRDEVSVATPTLSQGPAVAHLFSDAYVASMREARASWRQSRKPAEASRYLWLLLSEPANRKEIERVFHDTDLTEPRRVDPDTMSQTASLEVRYFHARWLFHSGSPVQDALAPLEVDASPSTMLRESASVLSYLLKAEFLGIPVTYVEDLQRFSLTDENARSLATLALATCHALSGRGDEALALLADTPPQFSHVLQTHFAWCRGLALYSAGRFEEAINFSRAEYNLAVERLERVSLAGHAYLIAVSCAALGRFSEAQEPVDLLLSTGALSVPLPFSPDRALLVIHAIMAMRTGRTAAANSWIERASLVGNRSLALPAASVEWAEAALSAVDGDRVEGAEAFRQIATELFDKGFSLSANTATFAALLCDYQEEEGLIFRDTARRIGGSLYPLYMDARAALRRKDPYELTQIATQIHLVGATEEAARFNLHASRLFREAGRKDDARQAHALAYQSDGGTTVGRTGRHTVGGFTRREREVVQLVAAGLDNKDIAAELFLSVRTVETHLRNMRRKVGAATNRPDLARHAGAAPLHPPPPPGLKRSS